MCAFHNAALAARRPSAVLANYRDNARRAVFAVRNKKKTLIYNRRAFTIYISIAVNEIIWKSSCIEYQSNYTYYTYIHIPQACASSNGPLTFGNNRRERLNDLSDSNCTGGKFQDFIVLLSRRSDKTMLLLKPNTQCATCGNRRKGMTRVEGKYLCNIPARLRY